jgi:hypothetical protein
MDKEVKEILDENKIRLAKIHEKWNPVTGEGSVGERFKLVLEDFAIRTQYLPMEMKENEFVKQLLEAGSINKFLTKTMGVTKFEAPQYHDMVVRRFIRLRCKYDFPFWAYTFVKIKPKEGGEDINFKLNYPQRTILVPALEKMRIAGQPIRMIILKARQWGGSTCIQIYMAWIQTMWKKGWNSLIVSKEMQSTTEVKGMFTKFIENYPLWMLHEEGEAYMENEKKLVSFEGSQSIDYIPQRNAKIKTGSAVNPDSSRGGDSAMVHCTEIGLWKKTDGKSPEDIVQAACSGVLLEPLTMVVYESTAKGVGSFFHTEWIKAKRKESDKVPVFVPWYVIELYEKKIDDVHAFVKELVKNKDRTEKNGKYFYWLWKQGASLEAINWYMSERRGKPTQTAMASEYPTDDIEAFANSGDLVFDNYLVDRLARDVREPKMTGELVGDMIIGRRSLENLHFAKDSNGKLKIWCEPDNELDVRNRYLVVVDIGGRSLRSDYSVIYVLDRYWMMYGERSETVAEWYGHIRHDILAWKAVQIATYYRHALLVFESNTLETRDNERDTDGGNHVGYVLDEVAGEYDNLYARERSAEDIRSGRPRKWGFHTNASTKVALIDNLVKMVEECDYIEHDKGVIDEYRSYEKKQNGSYGAIAGCHDDKLMTRGIAHYLSIYKVPLPKILNDDNRLRPVRNLGLTSTF